MCDIISLSVASKQMNRNCTSNIMQSLSSDPLDILEIDFGTVEPWNNNEPEILTQAYTRKVMDKKKLVKTLESCYDSITSSCNGSSTNICTIESKGILKSKPLPEIPLNTQLKLLKPTVKIQFEQPLGFTELREQNLLSSLSMKRFKNSICESDQFYPITNHKRLTSLYESKHLYEQHYTKVIKTPERSKRILLKPKNMELRKQRNLCYSSATIIPFINFKKS